MMKVDTIWDCPLSTLRGHIYNFLNDVFLSLKVKDQPLRKYGAGTGSNLDHLDQQSDSLPNAL